MARMSTQACPTSSVPAWRRWLIPALVLMLAGLAGGIGPIAQPQDYHAFADQRTWLGIPRVGDVLTNAAFVLVGLWGLCAVAEIGPAGIATRGERRLWGIFFLGVVLTGFGSSWYHAHPSNASLVWDRLPLTLCFASMLALLWYEFGDPSRARRAAPLLLIAGPATVLWWALGDAELQGDVRWYVLLQVLPVLVTPLAALVLRSRYSKQRGWLLVVACYVAAKFGEHFDRQIFDAVGLLSGHNIKHLIAAAGPLLLVAMLRRRQLIDEVNHCTPTAAG